MTPDKAATSLRLDPEDFPKRIEVELTVEVVEKIKEISQRTGRSISEVATDILSRALKQ
jgi:hypothetical protein